VTCPIVHPADPSTRDDQPLDPSRSLFQLTRRPALADPYPFYEHLRTAGPATTPLLLNLTQVGAAQR